MGSYSMHYGIKNSMESLSSLEACERKDKTKLVTNSSMHEVSTRLDKRPMVL